ncbi:MAG: DUF5596 domain-containing protein [Victivallales bacterium]|nr:DUF5596 domain-containing protein [Victivallales bacterium]
MNTKILSQLELSQEAIDQLNATWQYSQPSFPTDGVYFLQEDYLKKMADMACLCQEAVPVFMECGAKIRANEALVRLAWHCHWMLHIASHELKEQGVPWRVTPLGCTFFPAIVNLAAFPHVQAWYKQRGIPENILRDSLSVVNVWTQYHKEMHGCWGCDKSWMSNHVVPRIFRLHRLEFELSTYHSPFIIYRHNGDGQLAILAPPDQKVFSDGFFCQEDQSPSFTTTFTETDTSVTGYPALPNGRLANKTVTLPLNEWSLFVQPHDPMLGIHIPACAPLDYDECKAAIEQARDFFPRYCPEFHFKGFACGSWLLDPTLQDFLPPTSNIVRFQSLFHLYPSPGSNDWQTRERVFGDPDLPLDKVPQKTSLQRLIHDKILEGHRFRSGNMILSR